MRVTRKRYDEVAGGGDLIQRIQAKKVKREGAFTVTNTKTGEIHERQGIDAFKVAAVDKEGNPRVIGCPAPVGTTRTLRWKDDNADNPDDREGGNLPVVVTEAYPYDGPDGRPMWAIKWQKVGPHRPVPVDNAGVFLAPGASYVGSAKKSIDAEASVIPDEDVERIMDDERAAKAEARRQKIAAVRDATEAMLGDEALERWAHRIRQELDKAEKAA